MSKLDVNLPMVGMFCPQGKHIGDGLNRWLSRACGLLGRRPALTRRPIKTSREPNVGRDIALRCPRPRNSGRNQPRSPKSCAAECGADGAARRLYRLLLLMREREFMPTPLKSPQVPLPGARTALSASSQTHVFADKAVRAPVHVIQSAGKPLTGVESLLLSQ